MVCIGQKYDAAKAEELCAAIKRYMVEAVKTKSEKEKDQRKNPLAPMVYSRGYEVFISGICLKKLRSEQHETNLK